MGCEAPQPINSVNERLKDIKGALLVFFFQLLSKWAKQVEECVKWLITLIKNTLFTLTL